MHSNLPTRPQKLHPLGVAFEGHINGAKAELRAILEDESELSPQVLQTHLRSSAECLGRALGLIQERLQALLSSRSCVQDGGLVADNTQSKRDPLASKLDPL